MVFAPFAFLKLLLHLAQSPGAEIVAGAIKWMKQSRGKEAHAGNTGNTSRESEEQVQEALHYEREAVRHEREAVEREREAVQREREANRTIFSMTAKERAESAAIALDRERATALPVSIPDGSLLADVPPRTKAVSVPPKSVRDLSRWDADDVKEAGRTQRELESFKADRLLERLLHSGRSDTGWRSDVFSSRETLAKYTKAIKCHSGILVLPICEGVPTPADQTFVWALEELAQQYNVAASEVAQSAVSGAKGRSAPPLLVARDLLASGATFTPENILAVRRYLDWCPTICLSVHLADGAISLEAQWWLRSDDPPLTTASEFTLPPLGNNDPTDTQLAIAAAEFFMLLVGDMLSVGGYEGVSVLTYLLRKANLDTELPVLSPWYEYLRQTFEQHYGAAGLVGLPAARHIREIADSPLLAAVRRSLISGQRSGYCGPSGITDGEWLFQAVVNPREPAQPLYILAIRDGAPATAEVRYCRMATGSGIGAATESAQWLDVTREAANAFHDGTARFESLCVGIAGIADRLIPR